MRGYCAIGIQGAKTEVNVGTLWRSGHALGASYVFTVGKRYPRQSSDTTKAWRHIPLVHYDSFDDFYSHLPYAAELIGVEIDDSAKGLPAFRHPERAVYLLGAEDGGLPNATVERCRSLVQIPSAHCLNVATAGAIVLYDREAKA